MAGEFDLKQLLAAPVVAMNDAQADAAANFYDMLQAFAFEGPPPAANGAVAAVDAGPRRLRMISFIAESADADGRLHRREISMPLIQLIPIGGVGIDSARIEFSLAVDVEATATPATGLAAITLPRAGDAGRAPPILMKAKIPPTPGSQPGPGGPADSAGAMGNLKVDISLKQVDLPNGFLDMIAETQGGTVRPMPALAEPPPEPPRAEAAPLFTARLKSKPIMSFEPRAPFKVAILIEPVAGLLGPGGLTVALAASPARSLIIAAPAAPSVLPGETATLTVEGAVGRVAAGREVALRLSGSTVQKDDTRIEHEVVIVVGRVPDSPASPS